METALLILGIILAVFLLVFLIRKYLLKEDTIFHLPLQELGYHNIPAVPFSLVRMLDALFHLTGREKEVEQAKIGLSHMYTIQGKIANAYSFAYGGKPLDHRAKAFEEFHKSLKRGTHLPFKRASVVKEKLAHTSPFSPLPMEGGELTTFSLDAPHQFSLAWTDYGNVYRDAAENVLDSWSKSLEDAEEATQQFFPTIAQYGSAYNLLILQKVSSKNYQTYKNDFSAHWSTKMESLYEAGQLYIIDLQIYQTIEPDQVEGFTRFTPATFTWLEWNPTSKTVRPFAIYVSGHNGTGEQFYSYDDVEKQQGNVNTVPAWMYALQAAKTSVTVYGIWFGHVYHFHIVTAAMVMTLLNHIPEGHPIYQLMAPQATSLIGFNNVLVFLWEKVAPPTSVKTGLDFISLTNTYAEGREYYDDDPLNTIAKLGLKQEDFTKDPNTPWDQYPIIDYYLRVWTIVETYIDKFIDIHYPNADAVKNDQALQNWVAASGRKDGGNIRGLGAMDTPENLKDMLTSLLYRITAHGVGRMNNTANPALTFVGNFPPCLQSANIPDASEPIGKKDLLQFLPKTGTIGGMITFYYTFLYSAPYESLVPITGVDDNLYFPGDDKTPLNKALIAYRNEMATFIEYFTENNKIPGIPANQAQIHQWPVDIET